MTMEQVVAQLQQEVLNLRAQVTAQSGLSEAVRAINNLATAQVRKESPSLIDVKGLGHPKEFTRRAEDYLFHSKKKHTSLPWLLRKCASVQAEVATANSWSTSPKLLVATFWV